MIGDQDKKEKSFRSVMKYLDKTELISIIVNSMKFMEMMKEKHYPDLDKSEYSDLMSRELAAFNEKIYRDERDEEEKNVLFMRDYRKKERGP